MITQADITWSDSGDLLLVLPPTKMDPTADTYIWVVDNILRVRQASKTFVKIDIGDDRLVGEILAAPNIIVAETDEAGYFLFTKVHVAK
jgi:hypothetical protein